MIGLSHRTAPLSVREKVSFSDTNIEDSYALLEAYPYIKESFILSTCNRVELYGAGYDGKMIASGLEDFLYGTHEMIPGSLETCLYRKMDAEAVYHLSRVASGLDSMIIGESQILGQIKRSYDKARLAGSVGGCLHKLLQDALRAGRKVRSLTDISKGVTSIPAAALELIKREGDIGAKSVVVIGAGKIGGMAVARLAKSGIREAVVVNRDRSRAERIIKESIAQKGNVRAESLDALKREISMADIVITATASVDYVITRKMLEEILRQRRKGLLLIDLGVPRNIEDSVRRIEGVRLYNIDDLKPIVEEAICNRMAEAEKAEEIIKERVCEKSSGELIQGLKKELMDKENDTVYKYI